MYRRRRLRCVVSCTPLFSTTGWYSDNGQQGATLVDILVALAIAAIALTVMLSVLSIGVHSVASIQERATASALARSQIESIKSAPWPGPYSTIAAPSGYSISLEVGAGPVTGIQLVTVTVRRDQRAILSLQAYKGQR